MKLTPLHKNKQLNYFFLFSPNISIFVSRKCMYWCFSYAKASFN